MSKLLDKQINELLVMLESISDEEQKKVLQKLSEAIKQKIEMFTDLACEIYRKETYKGEY